MPQPKTMTNEATIERDFMRYRFLLLNCPTVCDKALAEGRPRAERVGSRSTAPGRGRSRPARKMIRRRKLLEIATEAPASGARFVGQMTCKDACLCWKELFCLH
jgi:hypothetical protein